MDSSLVACGLYTATARKGPGASALARDGHRLRLRGRRRARAAPPAALPPNEERAREQNRSTGHEDIEADAGELVRRVHPEQLDPEPADAVEEDVEREEPARADPEQPLDEEQHPGRAQAPERLVEERRMEGLAVDVLDRPVVGRDLERPREVRRLAEELLVPPIADAADRLRDQQRGSDAVHEDGDVRARAPGHDDADERSQ